MITILTAAAASAGPVVPPSAECVSGGLDWASRAAWLLALCSAPFLGWFFHRRFSSRKLQ